MASKSASKCLPSLLYVLASLNDLRAVAPASVAPKEWKALPDGSCARDLVGGEIFMAWMHDQRHGGVSPLVIYSDHAYVKTAVHLGTLHGRYRRSDELLSFRHRTKAAGSMASNSRKTSPAWYHIQDEGSWRGNVCVSCLALSFSFSPSTNRLFDPCSVCSLPGPTNPCLRSHLAIQHPRLPSSILSHILSILHNVPYR